MRSSNGNPSEDYRIVAVRWILARLEKDVGKIGRDCEALLQEGRQCQAAETSHEGEAAA